MPNFKDLFLTATLTAMSAPALAALTYTGAGSYNLGSASGPGGTPATSVSCGTISGQDALEFNGSGVNNIGIHAYACDNDASYFGSRASGENTYFAQGLASIMGSLFTAELGGFSFVVNAGEVGAFGSTAFTAGEFQKSKLTIKLVIDGTTYMDEAWSAEVGTGGALVNSYVSTGPYAVGTVSNSGDGYYSYGLAGGSYFIPLTEGDHEISYTMVSEAAGNILSTGVCTAYLQGGRQEAAAAVAVAEVREGPITDQPFASYCGAGARSGDPFPSGEPIARPFVGELPEPMSAGLTLAALAAAAGVRRRSVKKN
jgi:MYXO-CTERM domain-containing protein